MKKDFNLEDKAQSHGTSFCQRGVEMIDLTKKRCSERIRPQKNLSIALLLEKFKERAQEKNEFNIDKKTRIAFGLFGLVGLSEKICFFGETQELFILRPFYR